MSLEDKRFMGALRSFGQNGDGAKAAESLGKGWQPTTVNDKRGMFALKGVDSAQYAVLDRQGSTPTNGTLVSEYNFDKGKVQHFASGMYIVGMDCLGAAAEAIKVKSEEALQYNVTNLN
jgi:hypothetical protein